MIRMIRSQPLVDSKPRRVALVEVGSRAVRLLVAEVTPDDKLCTVGTAWRETMLAASMNSSDEEIRQKLYEVAGRVSELKEIARSYSVAEVTVFGTAALRKMRSAMALDLERVIEGLKILDKRGEALCSLVAAATTIPKELKDGEKLTVIDQGSGSVEIAAGTIAAEGVHLDDYKSYDLGAEALLEIFQRCGCQTVRFRSELEKRIGRYSLGAFTEAGGVVVQGSVATNSAWLLVRNFPSERYEKRRVHGKMMRLDVEVRNIIKDIDLGLKMSPANVRKLIDARKPYGDEAERILTGLVLLSVILPKLHGSGFVVSGAGTRYGLAWLLVREGMQATAPLFSRQTAQ